MIFTFFSSFNIIYVINQALYLLIFFSSIFMNYFINTVILTVILLIYFTVLDICKLNIHFHYLLEHVDKYNIIYRSQI